MKMGLKIAQKNAIMVRDNDSGGTVACTSRCVAALMQSRACVHC